MVLKTEPDWPVQPVLLKSLKYRKSEEKLGIVGSTGKIGNRTGPTGLTTF
jgi:hypothetical protein